MTATIQNPAEQVKLPTLVRRVKAMCIDGLLTLMIFAITSSTITTIGDVATYTKVGVFVFCFLLYEPIFVTLNGATLGHRIMKLRVKRYQKSDRNLSFFSSVVRIIVKGLLGWLSFVAVSFNDEKRAIHDMASGSIVIVK